MKILLSKFVMIKNVLFFFISNNKIASIKSGMVNNILKLKQLVLNY